MLARLALAAALLAASPAVAGEIASAGSAATDRTALAVTVYQGDLALVADSRKVALPKGESRLVFEGIARGLRPETVRVGGVTVREQVFHDKLVTPQTLLAASVGDDIGLVRVNPATGEERVERVRLLAVEGGVVVERDGKVLSGVTGPFAFDAVPPGLAPRPTLAAVVADATGGETGIELAYLTGGLNWRADYVARLSDDETRLALEAWATVDNRSGADYPGAALALVAGSVRDAGPVRAPTPRGAMMAEAKMADGVAREAVGGYHQYRIARPVTLNDGERRRVSLFAAPEVNVRRELVSEGGGHVYRAPIRDERTDNARIRVVIENTAANGLGLPLPGGTVRVYGRDSKGTARFLGSDTITHTAGGSTARLELGEDFDVPVKRVQTGFQRINDRLYETAHRVTLKNAGGKPVTVRVVENLPGDWEILSENLMHAKPSATRAEWAVPVPAGGEAMVDYRARVRL